MYTHFNCTNRFLKNAYKIRERCKVSRGAPRACCQKWNRFELQLHLTQGGAGGGFSLSLLGGNNLFGFFLLFQQFFTGGVQLFTSKIADGQSLFENYKIMLFNELLATLSRSYSGVPVSYTHLDVYKRQSYYHYRIHT